MEKKIVIGLMSGTSVDSVDAVAIEIKENGERPGMEILGGISHAIPADLKTLIFELFEDRAGSLKKLCLANMRIGHLFAEAVLTLLDKISIKPEQVALIGSHGQTAYHVADLENCCGMELRGSLQIGEASVIAQKTGIPVVSDFRVADIAAGGSGAPLVPFLDEILAGSLGPNTVFQNIGGIGNLTWFGKAGSDILAFDTGPGNMIIDHLVVEYSGGKLNFDTDGKIGREGMVLEDLLKKWMEHPYLKAEPPKSTGREEFGGEFFKTYLENLEIGPDLIRTATEYTVRTIVDSYERFLDALPKRIVIAGGGAFNPLIMEGLKAAFPDSEVMTGDEAGISSEFKEAAAFALMGYYFTEELYNNVPYATGAKRPVIMGKLSRP
ncbi:MAG: anhydro-N-acetylmuramic acid kinase [Spirochaetales bacterium]|nr:anhydro-N-acetylmuramic acid kinase [Spirochaetales bacterium]